MKVMNVAVLLAAGNGIRFGGYKQFEKIGGRMVYTYPLSVLQEMGLFKRIVIVLPSREHFNVVKENVEKIVGGETRQESSRLAVEYLRKTGLSPDSLVLVHDAVRPFLTREGVIKVLEAAKKCGAATVGRYSTDTVYFAGETIVLLDREKVFLAETPQVFRLGLLEEGHERAARDGFSATDDISLVLRIGVTPHLVESDWFNLKLTTRRDVELFNLLLKSGIRSKLR